jgi:hypothetical protein
MVEYLNMTSDEIDLEIEKLTSQLDKISDHEAYSYEDVINKEKQINKISRKLKDLICVLEVEHFLEVGPQGTDPL